MRPTASIQFIHSDYPVADLDNSTWQRADAERIASYWNGLSAPIGRGFDARLLWSDQALYVRFDAAQSEPLNVNIEPVISTKTIGLWERDVCEVFIAPDAEHQHKYFEFEIAPTGEWLDLAISNRSGKRDTDWDYCSDLESFAAIQDDRVILALKIPWSAFGKTPRSGDVWSGNVFRCVGSGESRGYLAWSSTMTETPNFHVPERFGELVFC